MWVEKCSSASRKFLNNASLALEVFAYLLGSALQRAENSSIIPARPQERKRAPRSALQRAENSSIIPTLAPASIHISDRDDHASSFLSLPGASP